MIVVFKALHEPTNIRHGRRLAWSGKRPRFG